MTLLRQIEARITTLSKSEAKVARIILAHGEAASRFSIVRLAQEADTSVAAVQRLCRSFGYAGYKDFRYELRTQVSEERTLSESDDPVGAMAEDMMQAVGTLASLDRVKLEQLSHAMAFAPLVVCTGIHHSGIPARMLRMRLEDLGIVAISAGDVTEASHLSRIVTVDACVIHFSVAGSRVPLAGVDREESDLPAETWLVTSGPCHVSGLPDDHVVALPGVTSGGDHAVMAAFVELLVLLVSEELRTVA